VALISLHNVSYTVGGDPLLDDVSLHVQPGERITLLGRNGVGKSTLLRIVAGELSPDAGRVSVRRGARLAYLGQEMPPNCSGRALDVATGAASIEERDQTGPGTAGTGATSGTAGGTGDPGRAGAAAAAESGGRDGPAGPVQPGGTVQTPGTVETVGAAGTAGMAETSGPAGTAEADGAAAVAGSDGTAGVPGSGGTASPGMTAGWDAVDGPVVGAAADTDAAAMRRLEAEQFLTRLGVDPEVELSTASGGVIRRVLLARTLAAGADALLLDEPTNHLDIDTVLWLEEHLVRLSRAEKRAVMLVTHDRAFARRLTTRVAELDRGRLHSAACGYDEFVQRRDEQLEQEAEQQREFERKLAREEAWIRRGLKARRTRNQGRVRRLEAMREQARNRRERPGTARMAIETAGRSGDLVIETEELTFSYGDTPIVSGLTTLIERGARVGIVGPNGSGKTTLLRLLLGELSPDSGRVRHGTGLEVVYFDQMRAGVDPDASVYHNVTGGYDTVRYGGRDRHAAGYLEDFLFTRLDMRKPARAISGGETNRLLLAKLFARPSNVLVLDEPTNDLDSETLELLEQLLIEYEGTILLVSHDREFLDNVVTSCLVLPGEGDGRVVEYIGGYSDWREKEARRQEPARSGGNRSAQSPGSRAAQSGGAGGRGTGSNGDPAGEARRGSGRGTAGRKASGRRASGRAASGGAASGAGDGDGTEQPRKLGFKERRELEELPDRIQPMEQEAAQIQEQLSDPEFYRGSEGDTVRELTERLHTLHAQIDAAYRRWEELESRA